MKQKLNKFFGFLIEILFIVLMGVMLAYVLLLFITNN